MKFHWMLALATGAAVSLSACEYGADQTSSVLDTTNQEGHVCDTPVTALPELPQCNKVTYTEDVDPDMNGKQIFDLTEDCVFKPVIKTICIRLNRTTFNTILGDAGDNSLGYGHVKEFKMVEHHEGGKQRAHLVKDIGMRVRGNTSAFNVKRQFKLKFDFDEGFQNAGEPFELPAPAGDRSIYGLAKLNLRASGNDKTMIRERLSSEVFTDVEALKPTAVRGGLVYRVTYAHLWVSDGEVMADGRRAMVYKGLYQLAEDTDKVFLQTRYQQADEKVKAWMWKLDLARGSFRPPYNPKGYDLKRAKGKKPKKEEQFAEGRAKIEELIELLDSDPSEEQLAEVFDIDNIVNYTAGAILTGHWDSAIGNDNNDLLVLNHLSGKYQLATWDLDNTFGKDFGRNMEERSIYNFGQGYHPLFDKIFRPENETFRSMLRDRLKAMLAGPYDKNKMNNRIVQWRNYVMMHAQSWEGATFEAAEGIFYYKNRRIDTILEEINGN